MNVRKSAFLSIMNDLCLKVEFFVRGNSRIFFSCFISSQSPIYMLRVFFITTLLLSGTLSFNTSADDVERITKWLEEGQERFHEMYDHELTREQQISELIRFYSTRHLGITYVGGLLEEPPVETLVITLQGSDCVLFVEHAMAMTMTTMQGSADFEQFASNLALFRYGDGIIDGYASRLHYFSDWLRTNASFSRIRILFQYDELPSLSNVHFMSSNRESYRQLAESDSLFARIGQREQELNSYSGLRFIPQDDIPNFETQLKTGDILSFVTTIDGLDISHTAIVKREGDSVGFWHASTTGSVIEDPKTIYEYTRDRRNVKGIIVARPLF